MIIKSQLHYFHDLLAYFLLKQMRMQICLNFDSKCYNINSAINSIVIYL